jgi:hypothetical protein
MGKAASRALRVCGFRLPVCAAIALAALSSTPLTADTAAQLESASRATDSTATGISLARSQIASDELLEAMATIERVMMNDPENLEARAARRPAVPDRRSAGRDHGIRSVAWPRCASDGHDRGTATVQAGTLSHAWCARPG